MAIAEAVHSSPTSRRRRNFGQRLAVLSPLAVPSRGMRFLKRKMPSDTESQSAKLADLVALPDWIMLPEEQVGHVASVATLLHFRRQIDRIVDGEQVRQICEIFGEEYFDMVCDAPMPDDNMLANAEESLPPQEQLLDFGKSLLTRALPTIMADRFEGACGDPTFLALANHAVAMAATCVRAPQQDDLP